MKTLIVAAIISVATADITTTTTSTIKYKNNSESTYLKNFTASTIKVSILTTENPELDNTTESTNVVLSRKNGTITRQGKITEGQNTSKSNIQYRYHQDSDENKYIDKDGNKVLQIEFVTRPETHRSILKDIFEKILSYKSIHLEETDNNEKEKLIKAYILLVSQKYKRKWVPKNIGLKLLPVKNVTLKGRSTNKRQKRSIKEDAGFTHDAETCKQYNNNLITLWSNLSKYIGTSEKSPPNKSVLHNIGIMIKAYLDHVTPIEMNTETATEKLIIRKERNISSILYPIVKEIKNKIDLNKVNEFNTLTAFILEQVKHFRIDNINEECNKVIQNQITTLINIAFKKYLIYANCNQYNNPYNGNNILNNMPLNNQNIYSKLQSSNVPNIDEPRYHRNVLKVVKRSPIETTNIIDSNTQIDSTVKDSVVSSNFNNQTKDEIINGSNTIQSRRAIQLNGKYCADLALDQFILTVKLILRLYLLYDDCTQGANKFIIISKLIEATPILEPFNENNVNYLSQYHVLLQLLDNMENEEMSNLFNIPEAEVLQNKNILEDFLHDINNLALISYKHGDKNNIADHRNDIKHQQIPNSLYNYQQLYNRLLNTNNAGIINAGFKAILPINEDKKINDNFKELQVMYTGVPINQHFVANQSVIYEKFTNNRTYTKPITIGVNLNSGSYLNNPSVNNLNNFLSASKSKTLTIPNTYSVREKDNFNVNPMHYNLIMNYSETYPTSVKGNSVVSGLPPFPYLNPFNNSFTDINPLKNTLLYQHLASNPGTLSNYISKFTKINSYKENQFNNSPPVPNNGVLMSLLTNNNRAMINNNFNTKSELNVNEANVKKSFRNPNIALDQQNLNMPSNFAINSGVNYYNQFNNGLTNINSNVIKNNNLNLLRDNLVREQNSLNHFNVKNINLHVIKPNILRSNLNLDNNQNVVHSSNIGSNSVLRNAYPLRPQIQNNPIISRTDFTPNSSISSFINNRPLKVSNSSYVTSQAIRTMSGVPLKNIQYIKNPEYPLKSLFINPYSYSAKLINKENEFDKFLNLENTPILRSNFLRTHEKNLETKTLPIISIDNLPTISSDPDANGDVELTYVFHHPQIVVYQPQVLVKRRISYTDYINNFNNIFNNQKKNQQQLHLYKIIRYLPHNNVQVLYQSDSLFTILKLENSTSSN